MLGLPLREPAQFLAPIGVVHTPAPAPLGPLAHGPAHVPDGVQRDTPRDGSQIDVPEGANLCVARAEGLPVVVLEMVDYALPSAPTFLFRDTTPIGCTLSVAARCIVAPICRGAKEVNRCHHD